jgi:muramoyltetrapeptide carboxypeptidase
MKPIKPPALKFGDLLGVVACSTPINHCSSVAKERGYKFLQDLGFQLKEAANCAHVVGHAAGTVQERVDALHAMFADPNIKGIISFWGGFQSHQLLEYLDYDLIKLNPKPFIGYSDTTALQVGIYTKTGLVSYSGPAVITFAKPQVPAYTVEHFKKVLMEPQTAFVAGVSDQYSDNQWYLEPDHKMIFKPHAGLQVFRPGVASGIAIGGNIGTMLLLSGTAYWPDLKGKILFVEEDESENPQTMNRMFTQLRQMGVYEQIIGMVIGRFADRVGFEESDSLEMILEEALKGYHFPVLTGADFGHTDPLMTIPQGISCSIDTSKLEIRFNETAVSART